jgi:hypothetical protein
VLAPPDNRRLYWDPALGMLWTEVPIPIERPRHLRLVESPSPGQAHDDLTPRPRSEPILLRRLELAPVLSRAMSAVIDALELGEQTPPGLIPELEHVAATAMIEAYEPIAEAAFRLARSTETSRTAQAANVQRRAEETAALVSETTTALRQHHDRLAARVAEDARTAARAAAASSVPGHKLEAKKHAIHTANAVRFDAAVRADQRAAAAALTAAAAARAEIRLAVEADRAAVIVERDALQAASVIQATALDVMYEIAIDAACRHFVDPANPKERER